MAWSKGRIALAGFGVVVGLAVVIVGGLVGYAAATARNKMQFPDTPYPAIVASADPAVIEQGRYLVHGPAHCAQCHSTSERENPALIKTTPLQGGLAFEMGPIATTWARNLTPDAETGIGRFTDGEIARAIRTGVLPNGELSIFMRFSAAKVSDEDLTAIVSYLRSIEPVKNEVPPGEWYLLGKVLLTYAFPPMSPAPQTGPSHVPAGDQPSIARGQYLADEVMLCKACHSPMDPATFQNLEPHYSGGTAEASHGSDHDMEFAPPNLTSSPTGVTGQLDEDAFVARMKGGRKYPSSIMPWENFDAVTDNDLRSVYRYLESLPMQDHDNGPSYRKVGWTPEG